MSAGATAPRIRFDLGQVEKLVVTGEAILPGEMGSCIAKAFLHSEQPEFHRLVAEFGGIYLGKYAPADQLNDFLVVIHEDSTAHAYVGVTIRIGIRAKGDIAADARFGMNQVADFADAHFDGVEIKPTDALVYSFRVGWRFGLYFDLSPPITGEPRDIHQTALDLGSAFRHLRFFEEYEVASSAKGNEMMADGWFPFMQLLGGDYAALSLHYDQIERREAFIDSFMNRFKRERIESFVRYWWRNELFARKQPLLSAGIEAYLQQNASGYINCVKTLFSEIEGIVQAKYLETYGQKASFAQLVSFVRELGEMKFDSRSLAFPSAFYRYISDVVFRSFDLASGDVALSRHSALHGVADPSLYTRARALQCILTLDQLSHYVCIQEKPLADDR